MRTHPSFLRGVFLLLLVWLGGCASDARFPENPPLLTKPEPVTTSYGEDEDHLLVLVTFSGGGSRAAALAYGVLEELAETEIVLAGSKVRLVDEIDMISAVSGGSITAAYYGLYGDRLFLDFRPRFLERDVETELASLFLSPSNLSRLSSTAFGRGEILSEYLDQALFDGRKLQSLVDETPPYVEINATDLFNGNRFGFSANQFELICSDINEFPAARAVAASSAVPLIFSPLTLLNRSGTCDHPVPPWVYRGLQEREANSRLYRAALYQSALLDSEDHPYIHLVDGGLTDNLGLRAILDRVVTSGGMWKTLLGLGHPHARQVVLIVVDAAAKPPTRWSKTPGGIPQSAILDAATTAPLANYDFETLRYVHNRIDGWQEEIERARCEELKECTGVEFYFVDLSLENLRDPQLRDRLIGIPTRLQLTPEQVQDLIRAGGRLLVSHPEFRRFIVQDHSTR